MAFQNSAAIMMSNVVALLLLATAVAASGRSLASSGLLHPVCPPPGFHSVFHFNLTRYISAPWYGQEQVPNKDQPVNELYCVRAVYVLDPATGVVTVKNYANKDQVNGPAFCTYESPGCTTVATATATVPNPDAPSQLAVTFTLAFPPNLVVGPAPYWVVALDPHYQWAIVSGGPPTVATAGGCSTGGPRGGSLYFLSRKPVDPVGTAIMRAEAALLGFDLQPLAPVVQEGCTYAGA